jgi:HD-like signal output (HDOD) protein
VLRLANSPMAELRIPPSSILQTLSVLGTKRVITLITTLSVGKLLKPVSQLPLMRRCWRHNLATALISQQWAVRYDVDPDKAFLFGLLAGIGRLALLISDPATYTKLAARSETEGIPLDSLEAIAYGCDHREAGAWLVEHWKLPAELLDLFPLADSFRSGLANLVSEADQQACRIGFGVTEGMTCDPTCPDSFDVAVSVNRIEQELGV